MLHAAAVIVEHLGQGAGGAVPRPVHPRDKARGDPPGRAEDQPFALDWPGKLLAQVESGALARVILGGLRAERRIAAADRDQQDDD